MDAVLDYLDRLLVARLRAVEAMTVTYAAGYALGDAVLKSPRLILVRNGSVDYRLDERRWSLSAGDVVLVPAMCRRSWTAGADGPLTLSWVQYTTEPALADLPTLLRAPAADPAVDAAAIERVADVVAGRPGEHSLEAEGEIKALLARFLARAAEMTTAATTGETTAARPAELAVLDAARWLGRHYARRDAVDEAVRRSRLSVEYFRRLFLRRVGMSPHRYLTQLRMRAARFHLHETQEAVKEVATRVGFTSPFHFSRAYGKFWGHPPARDRKHSK